MPQKIVKKFPSPGVYEMTIPDGVRSTISYYLWGAGGASGGVDGNGPAGNGASGAYSTGTLTVSPGDTLRIAIGEGGRGGSSGTSSGSGRGGYSLQGYSGGRGGNAGGAGWSGGGGGGGGASLLLVNGSVVSVAGGGAGGGGGSNNRAATSGSNSHSPTSPSTFVNSVSLVPGETYNQFFVDQNFTGWIVYWLPESPSKKYTSVYLNGGIDSDPLIDEIGTENTYFKDGLEYRRGSYINNGYLVVDNQTVLYVDFYNFSVYSPSTSTRGAQGADMPGDGGGGGGGGGGYQGGAGGTYGPDNSYGGRGGYTGAGGVPGSGINPQGTNLSIWTSPAGLGGNGTGASGGNGLVVLEFDLYGLGKVKVDGAWRDVTDAWVKEQGTWRPITGAWTKVGGQWKSLSVEAEDFVVATNNGLFGN